MGISKDFGMVHAFLTFMIVALVVVQDSAAQQSCSSSGAPCDTRNQSSCCSRYCQSRFLRDSNIGKCELQDRLLQVPVRVLPCLHSRCGPPTCLRLGAACDTGNQTSCCSGLCEKGSPSDGNNGTCTCTRPSGPCATNANCCSITSPPILGYLPMFISCVNSRCIQLERPPCLIPGASCDTGNPSLCCSGQCWKGNVRDVNGTCTCTESGSPCATNDNCCSRFTIPPILGSKPIPLITLAPSCVNSRCM